MRKAIDGTIVLNIAINLSDSNKKPITKEDALGVNFAPPDAFLDMDKLVKKVSHSLGPIIDGQQFPNTKDGILEAQRQLKKKLRSDYGSDQAVVINRKMLKG